MKQRFLWMLAAILTISGTMMTLTSCSNEDDNPVNPTTEDLQIKEAEAQLQGSWTHDLDCSEALDLDEMRLTFGQDKRFELDFCFYDYDWDDYFLMKFHGSYRVLAQQTRGGVEVQPVEMTLDKEDLLAFAEEDDIDDPSDLVNTMYFALRGDQIVIPVAAEDDEDPMGYDIWFNRGITDTKEMDKATAREFIESARKALEEAGINPGEQGAAAREITVKMPMRTKSKSGRELSKWMNSIPNDRKVCRMMIPGTHDSGTFGFIDPWQKTLGKTQFHNWEGQFEYGIRAFDIRTRYTDGENYIFHSMMNCGIPLAYALDDFVDILKENPTEGVILFIKAEGNDVKIDWDEDALKCLTWLAGSVPLSLDFSQLDKEKTTRETVKLLKETLLKEGLLAKFKPDMTLKDLRGKALVILENAAWKADNSIYDDLKDYIAISQDSKFVSPSGATAIVKPQNEWSANSGETAEAFANRKSGLFKEKLLMSIQNPNEDWWYTNAANSFINEMKFVPDYLTCASWTYPKLIDVIKANKGGSAIIVQDYAGEGRLVRVPAVMLVGTSAPAALVSAVGGFIESSARALANSVLKFFGFKFRFENNFISVTTVAIVYGFSEAYVIPQNSHGQELVETVVDSNFE